MKTTLYDSPGVLVFQRQKFGKVPMGSSSTANTGRVGYNRQLSTNISQYLRNVASYYGRLIIFYYATEATQTEYNHTQ